MKTGRLMLGTILAMLVLAGAAEAQLFLPPAGEDFLPATEAELEVILGPPGSPPKAIGCSGPTRIRRSDPVEGVIQTEIVQMSLSCSEGIKVRESPTLPSLGQIQASGDSFFDVFVEISGTGIPGTLRNQQPARVHSTIGHIPPLGSIYFGVNPVTLVTAAGQPVGQLVHVKHKTNGVPKPESSGEFSRVFSCFYECKPLGTLKWKELTTIMLLNPSVKQTLTASLLILNGHENPIARTITSLSPLDLDEINVCVTLERGLPGTPVPQAGLIEVVLSPTGGAYGWVKNLSGSIPRSLTDPFVPDGLIKSNITGIGKAECRLVGPNVTTPERILAIPAPLIPAILIEQTAP